MFTAETGIGVVVMVVFAAFWLGFYALGGLGTGRKDCSCTRFREG